MASAAALAAFKPMAGYSPIVARVCLPATSRNRKDHERTPAAVSRNSSPLQATSLNSNRPAAGGFADRSNASVRRTFKGDLEMAHRRQSYERHGHAGGSLGAQIVRQHATVDENGRT